MVQRICGSVPSKGFTPKVGSNLGPNTDKLGPKPCTMTQHKARRTNQIAFLLLPWAQAHSVDQPEFLYQWT